MDIWWIDEPCLLGSRNPAESDLAQLRDDGFGILVSLLREDEQTPNYSVVNATAMGYRWYNIPVKDYSPPTIAQLEQFMELVNGAPPDEKIIVHCQGGIGRTGTFAAVYWIMQGFTAIEAIAHIRKSRPHAVETRGQEAILTTFERGLQR